jgi:formate C-acetyltransferase
VTTLAVGVTSPRIAALREDVQGRGGSFIPQSPFLRDVALGRAAQGQRSRVQVRAALLLEVVRLANVEIRPRWRLSGEHLLSGQGAGFGLRADAKGEPLERLRELGIADEDVPRLRAVVQQWQSHAAPGRRADAGETTDDHALGRGTWGDKEHPETTVYRALGWMENHSVRDYAKVLRLGFRGIRLEVESRLAEADLADPDYPRKENFWRAAFSVCDAGTLLGRRYAELAARLAAQAADPGDKARLRAMAETCGRVPADGARTFFEAVQALWFAHILTCGEDGINANSIGRADQILHPYYAADLAAGRITRPQALELMEELACKMYLDYDVQAIALGGLGRDGRDATNDLSYAILEATRNVDFVRDLSVRLHRGSPGALVDLAAALMARGGGIPFVFNDECFVPALADRGIALEDARDYAPIGCIELTIPGRANPHAVSGWFNAAKCLELALFDGRDPRSGVPLGPRTGRLADFADFEALYAAYQRQADFFARRMVYHCNRGELAQREAGPLPCWSVLSDDCLARGRDVTDGGAVYNYHSIAFLGTANVADSLAALRKLVFEERRVGPDALEDALRRNYEGAEPLRQMLLGQVPKYGNDCPEVDALARRVADDFITLMDTMRSPLGGRYFVHLFSWTQHISFGKSVGALPDGRRAGEPLAYSLSAQQGRDEKGATAMLASLARMPHGRAAGASAAILDLDPALVSGSSGPGRLAALLVAAVQMGVGQLQVNVVTAERLRQAQADPERYGNIAVRVAGYSQKFRLIERELQEHIIARTKHRH